MYTDTQNLKAELREQFKKMTDKIETFSSAIIEHMPESVDARYVFAYDDTISINIPYNPEKRTVLEAQLVELGWTKTDEGPDADNTSYGVKFTYPGIVGKVVIRMDPTAEGSTCKLNLIGFEKKPVYEFSCLDAEPLVEAG
jgi:hypothetical protein